MIDALLATVERNLPYGDDRLEALAASGKKILLVTMHRRESWGQPMARVGGAVAQLAAMHDDLVIVVPVHLNPVVRETLLPPLAGSPNVLVMEPLSYGPFARLMNDSHVLLTDSGGVQEEGPSLGKPVLVLRDNTERPEAVDAGTVRLVGTNADVIVGETNRLLQDAKHYESMARAINPYGDGLASARSVQGIESLFGLAPAPDSFSTLGDDL